MIAYCSSKEHLVLVAVITFDVFKFCCSSLSLLFGFVCFFCFSTLLNNLIYSVWMSSLNILIFLTLLKSQADSMEKVGVTGRRAKLPTMRCCRSPANEAVSVQPHTNQNLRLQRLLQPNLQRKWIFLVSGERTSTVPSPLLNLHLQQRRALTFLGTCSVPRHSQPVDPHPPSPLHTKWPQILLHHLPLLLHQVS